MHITLVEFFKILFLGIVQGFTEPLPISSSGHLIIFETLLNYQNLDIAFSALINFGSTIAIIIYFKDELIDLIIGFLKYIIYYYNDFTRNSKNISKKFTYKKYDYEWKYAINIGIATIPLFCVGIILVLFFPNFGVDNLRITGFALLVTAVALSAVYKLSGLKSLKEMTYLDAFIVGIFQAVAFLPGLSRSGLTLVGLLILGYRNKDAFQFSFIMYIPASIGALFFSFISLFLNPVAPIIFLTYLLSGFIAFLTTLLGLVILKKTLNAQKLNYFAAYCLIVGGTIIFLS